MEQTSAIILAAGTSSRMGTAKQLLPLGDRPILAHVVEHVLAENFSEVIAVVGHKAEAIQCAIPIQDKRFRWVLNKDYRQGQGTSLKLGLIEMNKLHSSFMVFLADLPFISQKTIHNVFEKGQSMLQKVNLSFVLQPSFQGTAGHPVFFGHVKPEWFQQIQGDHGARAIMDRFSIREQFPVEDKGILFDIDTPEAFEEAQKIYRQI